MERGCVKTSVAPLKDQLCMSLFERANARLFVSEIVSILELFRLFVEIVLIQLAPWMARFSCVGLLLFVGLFSDDLVVCRNVLVLAINPTSIEDIAEASADCAVSK